MGRNQGAGWRVAVGAMALAVASALVGAAGTTLAQDEPSDTMSMAFAAETGTLDPAIAFDMYSTVVEHAIWDTLVGYDGDSTLVPRLAADLPTVSVDGRTFTFHLREGVQFVRHGEALREVTAADVVHSLNRNLRQDLTPSPSPAGPMWFASIEGAAAVLDGTAEVASGLRAVDDRTVEITLAQPDRTFLSILATPFGSIVPAELAGTDTEAFAADPVGSGPLYLESHTPGQQLVLARNPHYWRDGVPGVDRVELRLGVTQEDQFAQARANELDIMGDAIASSDWATASGDASLAGRLIQTPDPATMWLTMDTAGDESPFRDPVVRRAVSHAIDKDAIVHLLNDLAVPASNICAPSIPGYDPAFDPYPHSVEQATALMTEAGVTSISTKLYTDDSATSGLVAESIASDLAKIGIDAEVVQVDFDTLLGVLYSPPGAPMALTGWWQDYPDPSSFIDPVFTCAAAVQDGSNATWYCDPEVDAMAAQARTVVDPDEVVSLYQAIQERIMADAPLVPLFHNESAGLISERVRGLTEFDSAYLFDLPAYSISD